MPRAHLIQKIVFFCQIFTVWSFQTGKHGRHGGGCSQFVERNLVCVGSASKQRHWRRNAEELQRQGAWNGLGRFRDDHRRLLHCQLGCFPRARATQDQAYRNQRRQGKKITSTQNLTFLNVRETF